MENASELIFKGKLKLCKLKRVDMRQITVPCSNDEINKLWAENEPWQRARSNLGGILTIFIPKARRFNL